MDISARLAHGLAALSQSLDSPGVDLEAGLRTLIADLRRAVASYTGLTLTITLDGQDVSVTVRDDEATTPVRMKHATSLLIPLDALTPAGTAGTLLLYAATPGAFVDLAADLSFALGGNGSRLVLDGHLDPPAVSTGITGLREHSAINQAIGVLIGRGHTPESAREELHRLAALDHDDLPAAAERLIRSTRRRPTDTA